MDDFKEVQRIIAKILNLPITIIRPSSTPADLPRWDSLRHIILVMEIEHIFDIRFELDEIPKLDSIEKIIYAIQQRNKH